jgi:hypothetical protein
VAGRSLHRAERIADPPLEKIAQFLEVAEVERALAAAWRRLLQEEGDGVDSEAGDAEFQPEANDPPDFLSHLSVLDIEVGLEVVEPMEVVLPYPARIGPGRLLNSWEHEP